LPLSLQTPAWFAMSQVHQHSGSGWVVPSRHRNFDEVGKLIQGWREDWGQPLPFIKVAEAVPGTGLPALPFCTDDWPVKPVAPWPALLNKRSIAVHSKIWHRNTKLF